MTADDVRDFAVWRYDPPYEVYDNPHPVDESIEYFLDPAVGCHALAEDNQLVGFMTMGTDAQVPGGDYSTSAIDLGLGVRPDLTGQGRGSEFVDAVLSFVRSNHPDATLRVTISAANPRALRVWERAGFSEIARFETDKPMLGTTTFIILTDR